MLVFKPRNPSVWGGEILRASPISSNDLLNLNPTYQGVVDHRGKRDHVTAGGARVFRELFNHCFVLGARGRKNIEVRQYLRAVDAHVEGSGTGCREEGFGKVKPHRWARSRRNG